MPSAHFKAVHRCSSESKNYPASNLLDNLNEKWKCKKAGIDSAYVVLQLKHPTKIAGIDIGNAKSAFIEVSVGRNGWSIEEYKTILEATSFMVITECQSMKKSNRVRCFPKEALVPHVVDEEWDLVKVTCIQEFNTNVKFGLSFIKIHTSDTATTSTFASTSSSSSSSSSVRPRRTNRQVSVHSAQSSKIKGQVIDLLDSDEDDHDDEVLILDNSDSD